MWTWQCRVSHVMSTRGNISRHQRVPGSNQHLRSTPKCCVLRQPKQRAGTNRAHNGSEYCQNSNDHIDSAGSNCTPHHCVRCRTLRWPHSASSDSVSLRTSSNRLGVSNTQLRIALQSADISSAAQRVLSSTVRCVEHCDIIVVQVDKNVWIRMYKSVSSSMPTCQDCAVILSSSSSHTSWTVEFCISKCGRQSNGTWPP